VIVLNKRQVNSRLLKLAGVIGFQKKAAIVSKDPGMDNHAA